MSVMMKINNIALTAMLFVSVFIVMINASSSSSSDDDHIHMVVDHHQVASSNDSDEMEYGMFKFGDGKMITLARKKTVKAKGKLGCVPPESDPCGLADWCCEGLWCDGVFDGRCHARENCRKSGEQCSGIFGCCYPNVCPIPSWDTPYCP